MRQWHPSTPSLDHFITYRNSHTSTGPRSVVSSSYRSTSSIASGSAPSLGRPKKRARRGSKTKLGSSELNMSNLGSYPLEHQRILQIAKSTFVVESFAAGLFWPHQNSSFKSAYDEKLLEALSIGNSLAPVGKSLCFIYPMS